MSGPADLVRRLRGDYDEDPWGYDPGYVAAVQPVFDVLYDRWWRVEAAGTGHVGPAGPVLVVANHGGLLPWDAAMVATALERGWAALPAVTDGGVPLRRPRFLAGDEAFRVPWLGAGVRRCGGVPAGQANARRLLAEGHAVLAFPEGSRGAAKPWGERHRLQRFGRGGFAETALRARVPIVPCGVVGAEEAYPRLGELPLLARLGRVPSFPGHPDLPAPRAARPRPACLQVADRLRRADRHGAPGGRSRRPRGRARPRRPGARPRRGARSGAAHPSRRGLRLMAPAAPHLAG